MMSLVASNGYRMNKLVWAEYPLQLISSDRWWSNEIVDEKFVSKC